jgi:PAS domain S-box-containing protein
MKLMNKKIELFPSKNSDLVLSVDKDNNVLHFNKSDVPLLKEWNVKIGEKLPSFTRDIVQKVISQNSPEKIEVKAGDRVYLVVFSPLPKQECVIISGFDITKQKILNKNVPEIQAASENLELAEVIDILAVQSLMDDFYKLAHIPMGLDDLSGKSLVIVGWQDICTKFHRVHPNTCKYCFESNKILSSGIPPGEFKKYKCFNNMWDIATPIMVDNQHIGNIFAGQFFFDDEPLDYEFFRYQAKKYGFNEEEYIEALEKVPRLSRENVDTGMSFFRAFASMLSQLSYSNTVLVQSLAERSTILEELRKSEEKYRHIIETSREGIWLLDSDNRTVFVNNKISEMLDYSINEILGQFPQKFLAPEYHEVANRRLIEHRKSTNQVVDYKFIRRDGTDLWCILSTSPLFDNEGNYAGSLGMLSDITERKLAERALKESETHFRALAENSPDIIIRFDREYRHLYANPAAVESYNLPLDKIIGKTQGELGRDYNKVKYWEEILEKTLVSGQIEKLEYYILNEGKKQYFDTKIVPELADSKVISVLSISRDITDIKETESKLKVTLENLEKTVRERTSELKEAYNLLKESEQGLTEAQRMAHIGNVDWDLVTGEAYWSDELYHIFKRDPQKSGATYEEFLSYVHPDDRIRVDTTIQEVLHSKSAAGEYSIVLENGEERNIFSNVEVIFDEKSCPIRVKGTFQDITEGKIAEEQIRKLANIVESSNDAIGTISSDHIIKSWNKGAEHVYGYSSEEIINKDISILAPPNLSKETKKLCELVKQGKKIHNYETKRVRKDGKIIDISMTLSPVFDTRGKQIETSFISRDVSDSKKAEEKLLEEKKKAEVANRTKSDFLANMSHELRTPLNSIIGFSDILYDQLYGQLNERQLKAVGNISKSGKHLLSLINSILDLSKVEAGQLRLDYKDFELGNKLNMIRNLLSPIANDKNIRIEIILDKELNTIYADEDKFTQIMYNLVDNAVKFSYENNLIIIEARRKGDMIEIMVKDHGIGIKAEDQHKLFKPFSQIDTFSSKKSQGTGLGLSLVKQIVHLHGGYVWFRSNLGEGSTFAFAIPTKNSPALMNKQKLHPTD